MFTLHKYETCCLVFYVQTKRRIILSVSIFWSCHVLLNLPTRIFQYGCKTSAPVLREVCRLTIMTNLRQPRRVQPVRHFKLQYDFPLDVSILNVILSEITQWHQEWNKRMFYEMNIKTLQYFCLLLSVVHIILKYIRSLIFKIFL